MSIVIPKRFEQAVREHLVGNLLGLPDYPLILSIFGQPGVGKTFQLRSIIEGLDYHIHSINAADLESDLAGEPAKLLRKEYVEASREIGHGEGAAIVIDDIDTTLGEWKNYTGTVNHQGLIAFFMHIADTPTKIESIGIDLNRVPVFFTGNDFSKLYLPLRRPGRMNVFEYEPTQEEKLEVLSEMFGNEYVDEIKHIIIDRPTIPIATFANLKANIRAGKYTELVESVDFKRILSDNDYRNQLFEKYKETNTQIDWTNHFREAFDISKKRVGSERRKH